MSASGAVAQRSSLNERGVVARYGKQDALQASLPSVRSVQ